MKNLFLALTLICLFTIPSFSEDPPKEYSELKILDLDVMNQMMVDAIRQSRASKNSDYHLMRGLTILMSRPDDDGLRRKVLPTIKPEIDSVIGWAEALNRLANESIQALKAEKLGKPSTQVTHAVILESILSEIKPVYKDNEDYLRTVKNIATADIKISPEAKNEREMRVMQQKKSPSEIANDFLKTLAGKKK